VWSYHGIHHSTSEVFVPHAIHANAVLTPNGRLKLAQHVVDQGWTLARAAEKFAVSVTTVRRWVERYRAHRELGVAAMLDRSSRPYHSPARLPCRLERRILGLRVSRRWGPARIAYRLGLHVSTVHRVLTRYRCPRLKWTDPATGTRIKTSRAEKRSYVRAAAGDLVHVDIKKLGRIPAGGPGHRFAGRQAGRKNSGTRGTGYAYLHHAIDDHSRLVYSEIHTDERKDTAVGFWNRAQAFFADHGITVTRVMTDNGACYRSKLWAQTLTEAGIRHLRTRPYRPQTNGKAERFNRTLLEEWAYAIEYHSEAERVAAYPGWLHFYNHHRGHTALNGKSPIDLVPNLPGQNT
jgi:transposase InsO family protein